MQSVFHHHTFIKSERAEENKQTHKIRDEERDQSQTSLQIRPQITSQTKESDTQVCTSNYKMAVTVEF